jgi:ATP-binding cassette subfamily B protein
VSIIEAGDTRELLANLPGFGELAEDVQAFVADAAELCSFRFGQVIVSEGEAADAFYVIASGVARVVMTGDHGSEIALAALRRGDTFGELGLLGGGVRTATVRCTSTVEALRFDAAVFSALVRAAPELRTWLSALGKRRAAAELLRVHTAFAGLSPETTTRLVDALKPVDVRAGSTIVREGEASSSMYLIGDGRARVFTSQNGNEQHLAFLRRGDFFGERGLLLHESCSASVQAVSDCSLLELAEPDFAKLLAEDDAFRTRVAQRVSQYDFRRLARVPLDFADEILPVVGERSSLAPVDADPGPEAQAAEFVEDAPAQRSRRIRRFPFVHQLDAADCGAAALAMVCRHFGRRVGLPHIRRLARTGMEGTSLFGMTHAATALGLDARAVRASKSRLDSLPLPAIVHVDGNHWVVLYQVGRDVVRVADPARGLRRLPREELLARWSGYAALLSPTPRFAEAPEARESLDWLVPFVRPHTTKLVIAVVLSFVAAGLQMVLPLLTGTIVNRVIPDGDVDLLWIIAAVMGAVFVSVAAATGIQRYLLSAVAVDADTEILDFLTARLLDLSPGYFAARQTGDIERRLAGSRQVRQFLIKRGVQAMTAGAQLLVAVVVMFVLSWTIGLVYLATTPLYAGLMVYSSRRLRPMYDVLEDSFGKYSSQQIDAIKGIETVKALAAEESLRRLMLGQFRGLAHRVFQTEFLDMAYQGALQLAGFLSFALVLIVGALQVVHGQLSLGTFVSLTALVALANAPILMLLSMWDELQYARILVGRLDDVLEAEPEQGRDRAALRRVRSLEGRVQLNNVGFSYTPEGQAIIKRLTLTVSPGEKIAIVGRSGSGKTTLVRCLAGLLEPTEGTIHFDGAELRTLDYRTLRRQIGVVLQENYLFDDTIARNIAFGEDEVDLDKVVKAARAAHAHEFVQRLPLGYDTRVGESGLRVSGGQRQRIAIARALYHDPPLLLLDEATSALDAESERLVQESMDQLLAERTSFTIAHRLSTIRNVDRIIVLERGRIVEQGTHDELTDRRGLYFYLASQQLEL